MNKISKVRFRQLKSSRYIKPIRLFYETKEHCKFFDLCDVCDSVAIVIYNITRNVLVFVKQFRAGLYCGHVKNGEGKKFLLKNLTPKDMEKYHGDLGLALELCAGLKDKNVSIEQIAKEEVFEETGYNVPIENFEKIHTYNASADLGSNLIHAYYCEVTDKMKETEGGGVDEELIEVVEMTPDDWTEFMKKLNPPTNGSFIFVYYWFFANKYKKIN